MRHEQQAASDAEPYDPRDEYPVLDKLKTAGWITRYWTDRQDLYADWTDAGEQKMRAWRAHQHELGLESENQVKVLEFYSRYLIRPSERRATMRTLTSVAQGDGIAADGA